jgi:hypothetical protein
VTRTRESGGRFVPVKKEASAVSLLSWGATTGHFGEEEQFVGVEGEGRMAVEIAVVDSSEFDDADLIAGFFANFAGGGDGREITDIGPATRKGPATILEFADEEDFTVVESGDTGIDFASGVTGLLGEKIFEGFGVGTIRAGSHHFRGHGADFVIALDVELVLAISEARLGDGLQAACPREPVGNGHRSILAVETAANFQGIYL